MKEKDEKKLSWKEVCRLNGRGFRIIYKRYPKLVLSRFVPMVWDVLTPYISIYLSARIIGELAGTRDLGRLRELVLITLCVEAFLALGKALLTKWKNYVNSTLFLMMDQFYVDKLLGMDFIDIDDGKMH